MNNMREYQDYEKFFRKFQKQIPKQYNQIELMENLLDRDIDFYISISNRSDGKTFNYISFFLALAYELDIKFILISRHYTLRTAYRELLYEIISKHKYFKGKQGFDRRTDDYIMFGVEEKMLCMITDLNNATDLKYLSNILKDYPIIVYDEFLALETDYLPDEWERLKVIYQSVDRNHGNIDYLKIPKVVLLGNAVNFSSPILANLNIYEQLQRQKINTKRKTKNVLVEMRRNEFSNEKRNTRAFDTEDDSMSTGQFTFNEYMLVDEKTRNYIDRQGDYFYIKTKNNYLKVTFHIDDLTSHIQSVPYVTDYQFCTEIADKQDDVIYLKDEYYLEEQIKKYNRGTDIYFDNAYTKNLILNDHYLVYLNIKKVIKRYIKTQDYTDYQIQDTKEKIFKDRYIEQTKKYLKEKFS